VRVEPARLNSAIAWLFMLGASCFALGAIPAYVHAVGAEADAITFFVPAECVEGLFSKAHIAPGPVPSAHSAAHLMA
jgi:hypothetical protein